jgi:predicted MFS family arabinose efflux permease
MPSRRAALAAFFALGFLWGSWAAIVPAVQHATGTSKGELGLALLCVGLGSLPAMLVVGPRVDRRPALLPASLAALAAVAILPALAGSLAPLAAALLLYGACSGVVDVAINAEVAAHEAATATRSMPLAHALFSTGLLAGALVAGAARAAGAGRAPILATAAVVLAASAVANRHPVRRAAVRDEGPGNLLGLHRAAVAVAAICALAFVVEGALENWSALFLTRDLDAGPGTAALGPASYAIAMAAGRFSAQRLTRYFSDRRLLVLGGACAVVGTLAAAAAPTVPLALVGLALGGAGVSVAAPIAFGAAGRIGGARGIATVTTVGYLGFLAGPPIVGATAQAFGLRVSFVLLAGLAAAIAAAAGRTRLE